MDNRLGEIPVFQSEWTPDEIKTQGFRGGLFGFSRKEVRDFLRLVSKLWARMLDHQQELTVRLQSLETEVAGWRSRDAEIKSQRERALAEAQNIRDLARTEAEKLMAETEERAEKVRNRTEDWLENVIAKVEETQRQKQNFITAFRSALDSHYELIKNDTDGEPLTAGLSEVLRKPLEGESLN